jgi:hypothetical protein
MLSLLRLSDGLLTGGYRSGRELILENLALRRLLAILKRRRRRLRLLLPLDCSGALQRIRRGCQRRILHWSVTNHPTSV